MRGLILTNAYSSLPSAINCAERIEEEFKNLGVETDTKRNDFFPFEIGEDGKLESRLDPYDFCVYLDKDRYVARMMEKSGLRLFNRAEAIELCDDKFLTQIALSDAGVPMPRTIPGLLCYDENEKVKTSVLDEAETLGYPLVAKAAYGSLGKKVYLINDRAELEKVADDLKTVPHLFQRYVASSRGRDIRVIVIGGKAAGAMRRFSENDFRSNIELGGKAESFEPDDSLRTISERVAETLNLDYCGVDVLEGEGGYTVCEANSNAFFTGFEKATGINVARLYAEHILCELKK